jgi:hypothetical protein
VIVLFWNYAEFTPRSARVNFALSASKLVEQDAEYTRLVDETSTLVTTFQSALKTKNIVIAQLEVSTLQKQLCSDFATSLPLGSKLALFANNRSCNWTLTKS